jgi:hypothetical protein
LLPPTKKSSLAAATQDRGQPVALDFVCCLKNISCFLLMNHIWSVVGNTKAVKQCSRLPTWWRGRDIISEDKSISYSMVKAIFFLLFIVVQ